MQNNITCSMTKEIKFIVSAVTNAFGFIISCDYFDNIINTPTSNRFEWCKMSLLMPNMFISVIYALEPEQNDTK